MLALQCHNMVFLIHILYYGMAGGICLSQNWSSLTIGMKRLACRADLVQTVTSTQNRKCFLLLPVRQEVLLSTPVKLEVLMVWTGGASSQFWSMAYGPIKVSTTRTSALSIRSVVFVLWVCCLSLFVVLNCLSLVTHVGQHLRQFLELVGRI